MIGGRPGCIAELACNQLEKELLRRDVAFQELAMSLGAVLLHLLQREDGFTNQGEALGG